MVADRLGFGIDGADHRAAEVGMARDRVLLPPPAAGQGSVAGCGFAILIVGYGRTARHRHAEVGKAVLVFAVLVEAQRRQVSVARQQPGASRKTITAHSREGLLQEQDLALPQGDAAIARVQPLHVEGAHGQPGVQTAQGMDDVVKIEEGELVSLDRLDLTQAIGALILKLQQQWRIPCIAASVATGVLVAEGCAAVAQLAIHARDRSAQERN